MRLTKRALVYLLTVSMLGLLLAGCSTPPVVEEPNGQEEEGVIAFVGLPDGDEEITVADLKAMEPYETEALGISSSGEEATHAVKGVLLADLLEDWGVEQQGLQSIRAVANDGYAMELPGEILQGEVILAYEYDGEPLFEESGPIRLIVPNQRSMYWLRGLASLEISGGGSGAIAETDATRIVFIETAISLVPHYDYTYYESIDQAVKVDELFAELGIAATEGTAALCAADGFEKNEQVATLRQGYLKHTGEAAPLFLSPDLPKGMHVKQLLWMAVEDTALVSFVHAGEAWEQKTVEDISGIPLTAILEQLGVQSDEGYILKASDDYTVEIEAADATDGLVYIKDDVVRVSFSQLPKSSSVKGLLSIEAK